MNVVLPLISVFAGFAGGCFYGVKAKAEKDKAEGLFDAVATLKNEICLYRSGLGSAITSTGIYKKNELMAEIYSSLAEGGGKSVDAAINGSDYPENIKSALTKLFDAILFLSEDEIKTAFDATTAVTAEYKNKANDKYKKDAPLYRKMGILCGAALAIILL